MNILKKYLTIMLLLGLTCPATACNSSSSSEDEVPPHLKPENPACGSALRAMQKPASRNTAR